MTKRSKTSKQDQLIKVLTRAKGAKTIVLVKKREWQPHNIRTAVLRLRTLGYEVQSNKGLEKTGATYSIVRKINRKELAGAGSAI